MVRLLPFLRMLRTLLLIACVYPALAPAAAPFAPLTVRNLTPVTLLYGIPGARGASIAEPGTEYSFNLEHGSNFTSDRRFVSTVFFDGETTVANYEIRRRWGDAWEWGIGIPLVAHTNGFLDDTIDGFHELFDLPDGGRTVAPTDRLDYLVQLDGEIYANFQDSRTNLGDLRAWLGRQLWSSDTDAMALRAQIKLPTGSVEDLSGSEALDIAVWLEYARRIGATPLTLHLMGGGSFLGEGDLAPRLQEDWVWFGQVALEYRLSPRWQLHAQLARQTRIIDSPIKQAQGAAVQGSMGLRVRATKKLDLDFAFVEDIRSRSSADVVFQIRLTTRFP